MGPQVSFKGIAIREEASGVPASAANSLPVLHEVRHALHRLIQERQPTVIDLGAIPFGPGDEAELLEVLGHGEIEATLTALGPSRIWETAYPGVWLVDHRNAEHERTGLYIEVTEIPEILRAPRDDVLEGLDRLEARLEQGGDAE